jgi:hypothetical protein
MRPPGRRAAPALRLRSGETRIGRLFLPGLVLLLAGYVTYHFCQGIAASAFAAGGLGSTFARADLGAQLAARDGAASGGLTRSGDAAAATTPRAEFVAEPGTIHVMATSNGSPYLNYQTRIMYKTFTMVRSRSLAPVRAAACAARALAALCARRRERGAAGARGAMGLRARGREGCACGCERERERRPSLASPAHAASRLRCAAAPRPIAHRLRTGAAALPLPTRAMRSRRCAHGTCFSARALL